MRHLVKTFRDMNRSLIVLLMSLGTTVNAQVQSQYSYGPDSDPLNPFWKTLCALWLIIGLVWGYNEIKNPHVKRSDDLGLVGVAYPLLDEPATSVAKRGMGS